MVGVAGCHAVVDDARAGVELGVGVDVHEGVPLSRVEDVGDALPLQAHRIHRHKPASDWWAQHIHAREFIGHILGDVAGNTQRRLDGSATLAFSSSGWLTVGERRTFSMSNIHQI